MIISTSQANMADGLLNEDETEVQSSENEVRQMKVPPEHHRSRLDKVLVEAAPEFSRNYLQKLMVDGAVKLNGKVVTKPSTRVQVEQEVEVELRPTPDVLAFHPEKLDLEIVYEDEHLLVVNKPAGLVVHPGAGNWSGTLLNGLLDYHAQAKHLPRAGIVHRLDKETSGLMLVGKTLQACTVLTQMFSEQKVGREYVALAQGKWSKGGGTKKSFLIDAPIGRDLRSRIKMGVNSHGKSAQTSVTLIKSNEQYSLLLCQLHTGRTHQIRVHLASVNHPIVADQLYGGVLSCNMERQALHAYRLTLKHPITDQELVFEQEWPADLLQAVTMAELRQELAL